MGAPDAPQDDGEFRVLVNAERQYALWPASVTVPAGWEEVFGPAERDECVAVVDREWVDMRPRTLAEADRAVPVARRHPTRA